MDEAGMNPVIHDAAANRFEVHLKGLVAVAEYRLEPGTITFTHTRVPPELAHQGIATQLIAAGLALARARALKVIPLCPFVAAYMHKHHEVQDLLTEEGRKRLAP